MKFDSPMKSATKCEYGDGRSRWRADLRDPTLVHHGDARRHRHRLLLIVRDVDERRADVAVDLRQLDLQPLAELQVERAERLVEQQHRRSVDERARDRDPLLLAARELAGQPIAEVFEPDERERLLDPAGRLARRHLRHLETEADVVPHRHVREERVRLEDRVDAAAVRRQPVDALVADLDLAADRVHEAADQIQRRRLSAARRAEQAEELAFADVEVGRWSATWVP